MLAIMRQHPRLRRVDPRRNQAANREGLFLRVDLRRAGAARGSRLHQVARGRGDRRARRAEELYFTITGSPIGAAGVARGCRSHGEGVDLEGPGHERLSENVMHLVVITVALPRLCYLYWRVSRWKYRLKLLRRACRGLMRNTNGDRRILLRSLLVKSNKRSWYFKEDQVSSKNSFLDIILRGKN